MLHQPKVWLISGNYLAKLGKFHHGWRMNNLKPLSNSPQPLDIGAVRQQIDAIDAQLAALVVRRCGLSASVAAAKRAIGDTAFGWRPAREVEILRTVMRDQASLDPELAFCIWRALIGANLSAQGDLSIITTAYLEASAKAAFSVGSHALLVPNSIDVLTQVTKNDHAIGVLPWPGDDAWWVTMMAPEFDGLYVCAASPIAGGAPDVMLVAKRPPEAAGEDIALIAGPIGAVDGGVLANVGGLELVACGEFIDVNAPLPKGCRLIGCFALA